jgi:hypothetical protein
MRYFRRCDTVSRGRKKKGVGIPARSSYRLLGPERRFDLLYTTRLRLERGLKGHLELKLNNGGAPGKTRAEGI